MLSFAIACIKKRKNIYLNLQKEAYCINLATKFCIFCRCFTVLWGRKAHHTIFSSEPQIGFPIENRAIIAQRFFTFRVKIARNFDIISHWCAKAISRKFLRKFRFLRILLFPAISLFRPISLFWPISLNFEK